MAGANSITPEDRERYARAREAGQVHAQNPSAVVEVRYNADREAVELDFAGGGRMTIPRRLIPGLEGASDTALKSVSLSPAGDAISWGALDIDVYVPGLIERAFGRRLFAAATGRRGGQRRSQAKTAAAETNGAKGGRPRKRLQV